MVYYEARGRNTAEGVFLMHTHILTAILMYFPSARQCPEENRLRKSIGLAHTPSEGSPSGAKHPGHQRGRSPTPWGCDGVGVSPGAILALPKSLFLRFKLLRRVFLFVRLFVFFLNQATLAGVSAGFCLGSGASALLRGEACSPGRHTRGGTSLLRSSAVTLEALLKIKSSFKAV